VKRRASARSAPIVLGRFFSPAFDALGAMEVARVNIPVAVIVPRQQ
jgi:hypothetical protein